MGQTASDECACQESFLHLCVPEDPRKEAYHTDVVPDYTMHVVLSERSDYDRIDIDAGCSQNLAASFPKIHGDLRSEEAAILAAQASLGPPSGLQPPREPTGGSPPPTPHGCRGVPVSARVDVSVADILSNLEGAEESIYGEVFAMFSGKHGRFIGLEVVALRDFICTNSAITLDDVDTELLRVASLEEGLSRDAFLHLLRAFPISEGDAISQFLGMSTDGESLSSEECRSGLRLFAQGFSSHLDDERWERILNAVMSDAGVTVPMERWIHYCKITTRSVRLLRYTQVLKVNSTPSRRKPGTFGGA